MNLHNRNKPPVVSRRGPALAAGFGVACLLLGAVGCNSLQKQKDDPLLGVKPQVNPVPPTTGANPGSQARVGVPPVPIATSSGSTAALASLPGGRPLSINNQAQPGVAGPGPNTSSAPIVQPIPRDAPATPGLLTTGSWTQPKTPAADNPPSAPAAAAGDAQFAPLKERGAIGQFVDNMPEGVHLKVIMPNPNNAGAVRIYAATARDTAAAVQAVVQQIDQQR